jgi:hypothetical protein
MKKIIKTIESDRYRITSQVNNKGKYFVKVKSLIGSGYSADHYHYYLFKDGKYESREITSDILDKLLDSVLKKGDTEGFYIDIKGGLKRNGIDPSNIRHNVSLKEKSFTSRGEKLIYHWPIFKKYSETGFGSIVRATLTLHQLCSSHCQYCSTISRNKSDSITLDEAKLFVKKLYFDQERCNEKEFSEYNKAYKNITGSGIRLKGLILSGGGQPNLWPHFTEFVEWLSDLDIELGLITNGFPKKNT